MVRLFYLPIIPLRLGNITSLPPPSDRCRFAKRQVYSLARCPTPPPAWHAVAGSFPQYPPPPALHNVAPCYGTNETQQLRHLLSSNGPPLTLDAPWGGHGRTVAGLEVGDGVEKWGSRPWPWCRCSLQRGFADGPRQRPEMPAFEFLSHAFMSGAQLDNLCTDLPPVEVF